MSDIDQDKLDRAANTFIYLLHKHNVVKHEFRDFLVEILNEDPLVHDALRKAFKRVSKKLKDAPLTRHEMVQIIKKSCRPEPYKGVHCVYFTKEIYAAFPTHSTHDVRYLLEKHKLIMKEVIKKHPFTHTNCRAFILEMDY